MLLFELSMPGNNSWDGKWTGEGNYYAIIRKLSAKKEEEILKKDSLTHNFAYYTYSFGDGWRAAISVRYIDGTESRKIRKKIKGFFGYDWMVDSIIQNGSIIARHSK
jgi:hypothetical protein